MDLQPSQPTFNLDNQVVEVMLHFRMVTQELEVYNNVVSIIIILILLLYTIIILSITAAISQWSFIHTTTGSN